MVSCARQTRPRRWLNAGILLAMIAGCAADAGAHAADSGKPEKILFASNRGGAATFNIFSMNPDGSAPLNLTHSSSMELDPSWSPDHTQIVFTAANPEKQNADIYRMSADGSARTRLTESPSGFYAFAAAWSPNGRQIAYSTIQGPKDGGSTQVALFLMDPDGKSRKPLGPGMMPVWSPDGRKIACTVFSHPAKGETPNVYLMDPDGTHRKQLIEDGMAAAWSPDGKRILYMGEGGGAQSDLFIIEPDGSHRKALTHTPNEMEFGAVWSADGTRIYFTRFIIETKGPPRVRIYTMDADGSHVRPLSTGASSDFLGAGYGLIAMMGGAAAERP